MNQQIANSEFLDADELFFLTGSKYKKKQVSWLSEHGWRYIENAIGFPVVSRLYCRQKLSGAIATAMLDEEPDFGNVA